MSERLEAVEVVRFVQLFEAEPVTRSLDLVDDRSDPDVAFELRCEPFDEVENSEVDVVVGAVRVNEYHRAFPPVDRMRVTEGWPVAHTGAVLAARVEPP